MLALSIQEDNNYSVTVFDCPIRYLLYSSYRTPGDTAPPRQAQPSPTRQKLGRGYELSIKPHPDLAAQKIEQNCYAFTVGHSIE